MATKYTIQEAHSGTTKQEIEKAKRLYRKGCKTGGMTQVDEVIIQFSDVNYCITAKYYEKNSCITIGASAIN